MHISFIGQRPAGNNTTLNVTKIGDILTINGEAFDFSPLQEGETIPLGEIPCVWIVSPVERTGGNIHVTLVVPISADPTPEMFDIPALDGALNGVIAIPRDPKLEG
ncbi:hypothetical protein MUO32_26635 [Shinella sp. CPCC 101442]|uniref:hypothetical protein n=1 Tax=Shinella sp. CPCC 101442 TaxID=2932265 RepID=UPI0021521260|nr:hypothetical protein [Shinella sp. CPCC 101442]MCR6502609.1 hypothetical protein [Shinella sp. CPCC 101442]